MVDENADRAHAPGQQGVPERDIEPLWPPDQIDGLAAPPWDAPPPVPPAVPPTPGHPATPPYPGHPTTPHPGHPAPGHSAVPPSPADYPSLTSGGPTASGWAPRPGGHPPGVSQVDLNQPFTLDRPTSLTTGPNSTPTDAGPSPTPDQAETGPLSTVPGDDESTAIADVGGTTGAPTDSGADIHDRAGSPPRVPRPQTESPWAQPPQRPAPEVAPPVQAGEGSGVPPRPVWAASAQALPPVPQPIPGPPAPPQVNPVGDDDPPSAATPPPPAPQHGMPPAPHYGTASVPQQGGSAVPVTPQFPGPVPPPVTESGPAVPPYAGPAPPPAESVYPAVPPGPFPPQPAWNPVPWQQQHVPPPAAHPLPHQPYQPAETASRVPPAYAEQNWNPEVGGAPTAEDFARRRQVRPADPVATMGVRAVVNKTGLVKLPPGRHELERKRDIETVRRNFGGLRQVTVVNPKGGAGKTVAILLLAMTFGQNRGGYVLAWDNNETQGTLGMRAQQDFHSRTVRDLLRDLGQFHGAHGRVGDLSQYVRSQGEGMFDVLASDESATGGEMLTAAAFGEIREVVSRFYKLIFVDTGNNVRAQNWQAAMDATDQLVVTMSARNDSAETAARMLDHLEQSGRQRLVRQAVTVVSMPPSRKEIDLPAIQEHFAARTRAVLLAPYERLIDTGEPIRYAQLSAATRDAWLKIAAAVAEGL
ncbi:hypothetical protein GCM10011608_30070 [Micromonospora sonchi]|uniref:MinD-like ATPase involved in chromosome partitioning or flagellar assembly n=1 Tax=Micromonospora sonchi TaxID=1763543 RepID=A0A917TXK0_9ACTN|nr:chromosome partitioning protein [Micromonospora sonchi]GGM43359.1 hypothetical protein GCM10011608_30070 [Micromonospora sonchi]